jgi:hypothetical protein
MVTRKSARFAGFALVIFVLALSQGWAETQPKPGTKAPVITHSYAIEKGRYGDVIKVYVEADDPDADMLRIASVVEQVGYGFYPADWIYLKSQYKGHFSGYLQWNTYGSRTGGLSEWTHITIKVSVFDRVGNESNVAFYPFEFVSEVISNPSPPAPFNVTNLPRLGNIDVELFDPTRGGDTDPPIPD